MERLERACFMYRPKRQFLAKAHAKANVVPSGKVATALRLIQTASPGAGGHFGSKGTIIYALTHVQTISGNRPISTTGKKFLTQKIPSGPVLGRIWAI